MLPNLVWFLATAAIAPAADAPSSGDASATVQAEKLRMNVLELREISRSERIRNGGIFTILGAGLILNAALFFTERRGQFWISPTIDISQDASLGGFGVILLIAGIYNLLSSPFEDQLWNDLQALSTQTSGDRAIFLAEGEARFEATVQRAAFIRKLSGAAFIFFAVSNLCFHIGSSLAAPRPPPVGFPDPLDPKSFLAREIIDAATIAMGLFFIFVVRTPSERAWGAYLNDKNLQRPAVTLAPLLLVTPQAALAGLQGSF